MRKVLLCILIVISSITNMYAQPAWQWVNKGGAGNLNGTGNEAAIDIKTDMNGNTYVLSFVKGPNINIGGNIFNGYGPNINAGHDLAITSYKCDGTYRWAQIIGSADQGGNWPIDRAVAIGLDTFGGLYVAGDFGLSDNPTPPALHLSNTDSLTGVRKSMFLIKYDTLGEYQWIIQPQADTLITTASRFMSEITDMVVTPWGDVHLLCLLDKGTYLGGGYVVGTPDSVHILKFASNATFLGGVRLDMKVADLDVNDVFMRLASYTDGGRYYITGVYGDLLDTIIVNGNQITHPEYLCAFDQFGDHVWTIEGTIPYTTTAFNPAFAHRPVLDEQGHLFVTTHTTQGDTLMGIPMGSIPSYVSPYVLKIDDAGQLVWLQTPMVPSTLYVAAAAMTNDHKLAICGRYTHMEWNGYTGIPAIHHTDTANNELAPYIALMSTSNGGVLKIDTLGANPEPQEVLPSCIANDGANGVVMGGLFLGPLQVGGVDTITGQGSSYNFFAVQYGEDCTPVSVQSTVNSEHLTVWPNPASFSVTISSSEKISSVSIADVTGRVVLQRTVNSEQITVDVSGLSSGVYFVSVGEEKGDVQVVRFVKE